MEKDNDIQLQIKELERDRLVEEIRQLKSRWMTPAALVALLPLLGGFGWYVFDEVKKYNKGYEALEKLEALAEEKDALERKKDSLNNEVQTLLDLKGYYADEAERMRRDTVAKQDILDKTYLRGVFTTEEALYALDMIKSMPPVDANALHRLEADAKQLPVESSRTLDQVLKNYDLALKLVDTTQAIFSEFDNTLKVLPASDWTRTLQSLPTGAVLPGRKIMEKKGDPPQYYDIVEGRYLTKDESEGAR